MRIETRNGNAAAFQCVSIVSSKSRRGHGPFEMYISALVVGVFEFEPLLDRSGSADASPLATLSRLFNCIDSRRPLIFGL